MRVEHADIDRAFEPDDLEPLPDAAGVERTVLVQSANHDADTERLFSWAAQHEWIGAVVAWVDLPTTIIRSLQENACTRRGAYPPFPASIRFAHQSRFRLLTPTPSRHSAQPT